MVVNDIADARALIETVAASLGACGSSDRLLAASRKLSDVIAAVEKANAAAPGSVALTILGEAASKANSREFAQFKQRDPETGELKTRMRLRKSDKALSYEADALRQIPPAARRRIEGPVRVTLRIYYATERPDLDESVVLDVLQDRYQSMPTLPGENGEKKRVLIQHGVYRNDRQVREKWVLHRIDRKNPRCEVLVEPLQAQQQGLLLFPNKEAAAPF